MKWIDVEKTSPTIGTYILAELGDGRLVVLEVKKGYWRSIPGGWDYRTMVAHYSNIPKRLALAKV